MIMNLQRITLYFLIKLLPCPTRFINLYLKCFSLLTFQACLNATFLANFSTIFYKLFFLKNTKKENYS